jgi:hypothetical protein
VKKKRFSVEQIVSVLKEAELGTPVAEPREGFGGLGPTPQKAAQPMVRAFSTA